MIYLDHNSTTPIAPEVVEAMVEVYRGGYGNPASQHQLGQKARRLLEETRERIIELLGGKTTGMDADRLIFTSGGTEANNLMLRGLAPDPPAKIVISAIEHPSILATATKMQSLGYDLSILPVRENGTVDLEIAESLLKPYEFPTFACVILASNETGAVQPFAEIHSLCMASEIPIASDAVQAIGKVRCSFRELEATAISVAAHKFRGPVGVGALLLRHDVELQPQLFGGFQQDGLRPGTQALALAIGMRAALEHALATAAHSAVQACAEAFWGALVSGLREHVYLNSGSARRLPNTLNIAFLGVDRQELLLALDMAGICCSTGSACASGSSEPSHVLTAMGLAPEVISSSLRFSFGVTNTMDEAEEAARRIIRVVNDLRSRKKPGKSALPHGERG